MFPSGRFEGKGHWIDAAREGDYTVSYDIALADASAIHTVHRIFLKPDGSTTYEEHTTVTFTPGARNRFNITIQSAQGEVHGAGYSFENQHHYDLDVTPDNHLEWTFTVAADQIEGLASATNKGNFTSWKEWLRKV